MLFSRKKDVFLICTQNGLKRKHVVCSKSKKSENVTFLLKMDLILLPVLSKVAEQTDQLEAASRLEEAPKPPP